MAVRKATTNETRSRTTPAKQSAPRKASASTPTKGAAAKKAPAKGEGANKKVPARAYPRREDLGAPVDHFFARQPPEKRAQLEALHALVKKAAPDARASIKWGMPHYELKGGFCSLYAAPAYVALNLLAPPEKFDDPEGRLEGTGKTMRHLKVRSAADLDEVSILRWLETAVARHS